ncbi:MAG TPA: PQQ-binding-like beta-propeller repeat protein [Candidatus Polarisedimenticolaceae bacterium]|nr:PQQ-binding-like beta-propeller repeat protein [Candidatus Polarisedimenticolaceae bacterium]
MAVRKAALPLLLLAAPLPAAAQTLGPGYPDRYPPPLPARRGPKPPPLAFSVTTDVPLLGPVSANGAGVTNGRVVLRGPLGFVSVPLAPGGEVEPAAAPPLAANTDAEGWVYAPEGGWRYRTLPAGEVVAQRWWGSRYGWRPRWSLRVGSGTPSPPVLVNGRLIFGALDDQVYAVRADNGHRLWMTDVKDRVSRPLALWRGTFEVEGKPREVDVVLVTPDDALTVQALDVFDGSPLASFSAEKISRGSAIVSAPLVTEDGKIVVAHQGYAPEDASVLVLRLDPQKAPGAPTPPGEAPAAPL